MNYTIAGIVTLLIAVCVIWPLVLVIVGLMFLGVCCAEAEGHHETSSGRR